MDGAEIGADGGSGLLVDHQTCTMDVSLVAPWLHIDEGLKFRGDSHIDGMGFKGSSASIGYSKQDKPVSGQGSLLQKILAIK